MIDLKSSIHIETNKSLKFENVISFRKKMKTSEVDEELAKLGIVLQEQKAKKLGPVISATFAFESLEDEQFIDVEFLVPIDRKIDLPKNYEFKPQFHLTNALYTRYVGNPINIQNTYNDLLLFMKLHQFTQITAAYNVNMNEVEVAKGEESIIDIYIGINPNVL